MDAEGTQLEITGAKGFAVQLGKHQRDSRRDGNQLIVYSPYIKGAKTLGIPQYQQRKAKAGDAEEAPAKVVALAMASWNMHEPNKPTNPAQAALREAMGKLLIVVTVIIIVLSVIAQGA